jgi:hypothetical protein
VATTFDALLSSYRGLADSASMKGNYPIKRIVTVWIKANKIVANLPKLMIAEGASA